MDLAHILHFTAVMSSMIQSIPASANMEIIDDYEEYFEEEVSSMPQPYLYDDECITDYYQDYDYSVFIDPTLPKKDGTQCNLQKIEKKITVVCSDINLALQFHRNSTVYVLASGANITHYLKENENTTFFEAISDVAFVGNVTTETARVECLSGAGLAFQNVNRIRLQNIEFSHCGTLRPSTSKNFTTSDTFSLEEIMVSLYFYNCTSVVMCRLTVQHSTNALGVCMYDTDGTVSVYNSSFVNNTVQDDGAVPVTGGGGFVVEFSYCIPGDLVCNSTNHQTTHNSNSNYVFFRSNFTDNIAKMGENNMKILPVKETHSILGQGGGLAIYFKGNTNNNTFLITGCQFNRNQALFGGGLYIAFEDESISNRVDIIRNFFLENRCKSQSADFGTIGGGMRILSILTLDSWYTLDDSVEGNSVLIKSYFVSNRALNGGAISFSPANQKILPQYTTSIAIIDSVFHKNYGRLGAAIHLELFPVITSGITSHVLIENCTVQYNSIDYDPQDDNYETGIGSVFSFQIPLKFHSQLHFSNNVGTALAIIETYADFCNSTSSFLKNTGDTGGAIALLGSSYVLVDEDTKMYFADNFAREGGAIYNYDISPGVLKSSIACFVRYNDPFLDRRQWKASFTFINNTSDGVASNSIFSTSVYPCTLTNLREEKPNSEILLFCIKPYWNFGDSNCTSQIETQGKDYVLKNGSTLSFFPGKGFRLPITVFDDLGHDITSSVGYTPKITSNSSNVDPKYARISGNYLIITGQENTTVSLELQSSESRPHLVQVNVDLLVCPPGFQFIAPRGDQNYTDDSLGRCKCHSMYSYRSKLNCSLITFQAQIPRNYWIGIDPTKSGTDELVMGSFPNLFTEQVIQGSYYFVLPTSRAELDESICGITNRTGPLCGQCKEGYSTAVNSYDYVCTTCNDETNFVKNIVLYMIFAYLPYVIILGGITFFNLKLTSSSVTGFILYAQMISIDIFDVSGSSRVAFLVGADMYQSYHFVYGIFNFHSFANVMNPICIGKNFTCLDVLCLEYTLAALPLLIIGIILLSLRLKRFRCLCCRKQQLSIHSTGNDVHAKKKKKRLRSGDRPMLHAFIASILLSYTKVSVVTMKMLATHQFFDEDGNDVGDVRVFLAGHLSFLSKEYIFPYGVIGIFFMIFVLIPPLFLLGLTQLVDRLLDHERFACFRKVWPTLMIHAILDTFQGYYKPNRRIFAGIYFVFRLCIMFTFIRATDYLTQYALQQIFIVIMISLLAVFKPYRREIFNIVDIFIFLNLASINTITAFVYSSSLSIGGLNKELAIGLYRLQYCLLWLPLLYMLTYIFCKFVVKIGLYQYMVTKLEIYRSRLHRRSSSSQDLLDVKPDIGNSVDTSSIDESFDSSSDFLSDSALFKRAEVGNRFRSTQRGETRRTTLVSVLSGREEITDTTSSGIGTGFT